MVVGRRSLFFMSIAAILVLTTAAPALGAFDASDPNPLRKRTLIRLGDVIANGSIMAVGYREGPKPGRLFVNFSKDGGDTFLKSNGKPRRFPVAGFGKFGISLDFCDKTIWAGSSAHFPGDSRANDSDVLVTRRPISGGQGQAFVTSPNRNRRVRSVDVDCIGKGFLAVAWLEKLEGTTRARLIIQDQGSLAAVDFKRSFNLGKAILGGGISVAATGDAVHVAWTRGKARNVMIQRFGVGEGDKPVISKGPVQKIGSRDAMWPQLAARGGRVAAAYTDAGKVKVKVSDDGGKTYGGFDKVVPGKKGSPSKAHSIDLSDDRIVVEAERREGGSKTPVRVETEDFAATWTTQEFGHRGARRGALERTGSGESLLKEAWHNNGRAQDTLRAQHEVP